MQEPSACRLAGFAPNPYSSFAPGPQWGTSDPLFT